MEDGREVLARIPNPDAGHPKHIVASEVAIVNLMSNPKDFLFESSLTIIV